MHLIQSLAKRKLISPPKFLPNAIVYLTLMGSHAYGWEREDSDWDVYGVCVPHKEKVFPHLAGEIAGYDQRTYFEQYQEQHVIDPDARGGKGLEYDMSIYSIIKYFVLLKGNNPNILDSLFTSDNCVLHITKVGHMIRDNRSLFLHKGCWHKFKGYAYSQLHKMENKKPEGKRKVVVEKYGYDVNFASHVVRLLMEVEQILAGGDLDLRRNSEQLKAIRRGEWTEDQVRKFFEDREQELAELYAKSDLRYGPAEEEIKQLLLDCLEEYFGSLDKCIVIPDKAVRALREVQTILDGVRDLL